MTTRPHKITGNTEDGVRSAFRATFPGVKFYVHAFGPDHFVAYPRPSFKSLERMVFDGIATTPDKCRTEVDGSCPHGLPSWTVIMGIC